MLSKTALTALGSIVAVGAIASARMVARPFALPAFDVIAAASHVTRAGARGRAAPPGASTIAAIPGGVLVIDGDSGLLARIDRARPGAAETIAVGVDAGPLLVEPAAGRAYVVDRRRDRIAVVATGGPLALVGQLATRTDPVGLALADGGKILLVASAADGRLSALEVEGGRERWSVEVGPEPRAVAVSPDGGRALVTLLRSSAVAEVALTGEIRTVRHLALGTAVGGPETFARGAFAAAYLPDGTAIVPHQVMTPQQTEGEVEARGSYGGGGSPPVAYMVAFLDGARRALASAGVHGPRALAYDAVGDTLYLAGYGSDDVTAVARASQASRKATWKGKVIAGCGPAGIAVAGDELAVHCALLRQVWWVAPGQLAGAASVELGESQLSALAARGRELFRRGGDSQLSQGGALACDSCHPEGGADGLSWRIEGRRLQTPFLGGRIAGTEPYKWDGADRTLTHSLRGTIRRLGGSGLPARDVAALAAYLRSIDRPRAPARHAEAVARGQALFAGELGCTACHGGTGLTDRRRHDLADDLARVDTPSLIGLGRSAPYYHDGSAETLRALLLENGSIHGMGDLAALPADRVDDLVAYLETL